MDSDQLTTDDAKLIEVLVREGLALSAHEVADRAGVDREHAGQALARMADDIPPHPIGDWLPYPILRRTDLGADVYEAIDGSAREGGDA